MLDIKQLGIKIALLRKQNGLSQEKLAEMLCISPQAISKWENGHTMPETSLLPVLSQIFNCTIDEIIMPAYSFDSTIEEKKTNMFELQAKHIAKYVIQELGDTIPEKIIGLDDNTIIDAIRKRNPNLGNCEVTRSNAENHDRYTGLYITVTAPQKEIRLVEKIYCNEDKELLGYNLFSQYTLAIPQIYYIDFHKKILLMEDLNDSIQGFHFDEHNESGEIFRKNYNILLGEIAKLHATFWENEGAFKKIGLDWRHAAKENLLAHINGMEQDFLKYRRNEEEGKIPKMWNGLSNTIDANRLDYFQDAIKFLKQEYVRLLDERFHIGKNITIIHGDLHPGNIFLSKSTQPAIKIIDMEAVRIGLCTEDLAMLLALHIEPDKKYAKPLIDYYYECLCQNIKGYSYELFMSDYRLSIMEIMFWTIRLINSGICDFVMRDKAIRAYESFVLDNGADS